MRMRIAVVAWVAWVVAACSSSDPLLGRRSGTSTVLDGPAPRCVGTPNEDACEQSGVYACDGEDCYQAEFCVDADDKCPSTWLADICDAQQGCHLVDGYCGSEASPCPGLGENDCLNWHAHPSCIWAQRCRGTMNECEGLIPSLCAAQPGCSLEQ